MNQEASEHRMHPLRDNSKLLGRARRIRSQIEAIELALMKGIHHSDTLKSITSARIALNRLMFEILQEHIRTKIIDPTKEADQGRAAATQDLLDTIRSYLK